jgi:hypothetical protein
VTTRAVRLGLVVVVSATMTTGCARLMRLKDSPRPLLTPEHMHAWTCGQPEVGCTLSGTLHNLGSGCAAHVSALVRLFNERGEQLGESFRWRLPSQQLVEPKDDVPWRIDFIPLVVAKAMRTYEIHVEWTTERCNISLPLGRKHKGA